MAVKVVVVLVMSVNATVKLLAVEDCHLVILPVWPLKVRRVELLPVHLVALPAMVPPTDAGLTVTATEVRVAEGQEVAFAVQVRITCPLPVCDTELV